VKTSRYDPFRYKRSREDSLILKRGPRFNASGKQYNPIIRRIIASHRRALQPLIDRCIRLGGRYCKELAGWKETRLDDCAVVQTFINPFGLAPHLESRIISCGLAAAAPPEPDLCVFRSGLVVIEQGIDAPLNIDGLLPSFYERALDEQSNETFGPFVPTDMVGSFSGGSNCISYAPYPGSIGQKMPGRYTGEMRKVVQILAGKRKSADISGITIQPEFCFSKTHGVWVGDDGSRWLIEISQSDGVRYKPLPICNTEPLTPEQQSELGIDINYIPSNSGYFCQRRGGAKHRGKSRWR